MPVPARLVCVPLYTGSYPDRRSRLLCRPAGPTQLIAMTIASETEERRQSIADHLNKLIAICKDGQAGYRAAANDTKDPELRELFNRLSRQRGDFAVDLQDIVRELHCQPRRHSSLAGAVHRGWLNLKAALTDGDHHSALVECERGEDAAVEAFRKVLEDAPLDGDLRRRISNQAFAVRDAHDEVCFLRDRPEFNGAGPSFLQPST